MMLAKCGLGAGRCDKVRHDHDDDDVCHCDMFQECASIEVEEHTGCVCGCDPGLRPACEARQGRVYREETCQCQCRDIQVRHMCRLHFGLVCAWLLLLCSS